MHQRWRLSYADITVTYERKRSLPWKIVILGNYDMGEAAACLRGKLFTPLYEELPGILFQYTNSTHRYKTYSWFRTGWSSTPRGALKLMPPKICLYMLGMSEILDEVPVS